MAEKTEELNIDTLVIKKTSIKRLTVHTELKAGKATGWSIMLNLANELSRHTKKGN